MTPDGTDGSGEAAPGCCVRSGTYRSSVSFDERLAGQQPVDGFIRNADAGTPIELPGWSMRVTVGPEHTAHRLTVLHATMDPLQPGPRPHVHAGHDETFVMLAGRLRFRLGSDFHTARPGETVFAGRYLAHGFSNPYDEPARYVAILSPSGYEDYFRRVAEHVARTGVLPDRDGAAALMAEYDTVPAPDLVDPA
jgi:quercetin dioxygenase-like cupin family protein